jgi:hypothetical protein
VPIELAIESKITPQNLPKIIPAESESAPMGGNKTIVFKT